MGRRLTFAFLTDAPPPAYDVVFANTVGTPGSAWDYWSATVESIEHGRIGAVMAVDNAAVRPGR